MSIGSSVTYSLGSTGGSATHTLTTSELPAHTHTANSHTHTITDAGHNHRLYSVTDRAGSSIGQAGPDQNVAVIFDINGTHGYAEVQGDGIQLIEDSTTGVTVNSASTIIQNTGSGVSHNNMPPYIATNFIVKVRN
jgi:microcystin-dependent protein